MVFVLCQALLYVLRNVDGFNPHANPGRERLLLSPFDGWSNWGKGTCSLLHSWVVGAGCEPRLSYPRVRVLNHSPPPPHCLSTLVPHFVWSQHPWEVHTCCMKTRRPGEFVACSLPGVQMPHPRPWLQTMLLPRCLAAYPALASQPLDFVSPPAPPVACQVQPTDFRGLQAPLKGAPLCSSSMEHSRILFFSAVSLTTKLFCLPTCVLTDSVSSSLFPLGSSYPLPVQLLDCLF